MKFKPGVIRVSTAIVGAGVQGVALAAYMRDNNEHVQDNNEKDRDLLLIDPEPCLTQWLRATRRQGLRELRTPGRMHIDPGDPIELLDYDEDEPGPLSLFNAIARAVMSDFEIRKRHLAGRAILLKESSATGEKILTVSTSEGPRTVRAKRVVVAAGLGRPFNPLRGEPSPRVRHASEIDIHQVPWASRKRVCIVGGGLTAATLAVGFSRKGYGVTLCTRGSISVGQLETDTRWAPGDEFEDNDFYDIFARTMSMKERARMIRTARVGHRITPRIWSRLIRQSELGNIDIREHSPHDRWEISADRRVHLPGILGTFDSLICATGYRQDVRELAFLKPMLRDIEVFEGLPVVKRFESSVKGLYFIGKLGELYGGPLSRNIPGARFAARMLADRFVRNSPY